MFPTLGYLLSYLFGSDIHLGFPTFGFMMALAFLGAATVLASEIKRKQQLGIIPRLYQKEIIGLPASTQDLIGAAIFGFIIAYKLVYAGLNFSDFFANPQFYILSSEGNTIAGVLGALIFGAKKYYDKKKTALPQPKEEIRELSPGEITGSITMVAAISGIIGAKFFHYLEYPSQFINDPVGAIASAQGLTFYGGLIGGTIAVMWYVNKRGIKPMIIADCVAPGLILAYAIGRIGCQLSGDGDWGVLNSAYRADATGNYRIVPKEQLKGDIILFKEYYASNYNSPDDVDSRYLPKPSALAFLPDWMFAYNFPQNVLNEGVPINGCTGSYCSYLPIPVFPTAFYETLMGLLIFGLLWLFRKRIPQPGKLFCLYLILNGMERFTIEQIRVNVPYHLFGMNITQAEIIAIVLIIIGISGFFLIDKLNNLFRKKADA